MPYYRRRKVYRKKNFKRKWRFNKRKRYNKRFGKVSRVVRRGQVFPDSYFCKLKYEQTLNMKPFVAAPISRQLISGNGIHDVDISGLGHQPMGYDQITALYNSWKVYASSIKVQVMTVGSGAAYFSKFSLYPTLNSSIDLDLDEAGETPYGRSTFVSDRDGGNKNFLSNFMTTKKIYGQKSIDPDPSFTGAVGSNPSALWYWILDMTTIDGSTNIGDIYVNIKVKYYVKFWDRIQLTGS